ncbi:hypothetical protein [Mycobacterium sp.]|uniref:hypothetical protein n=1 Tax=Mycobacterium sp. TaxID=1785 RepID=UPI003F96C7AE
MHNVYLPQRFRMAPSTTLSRPLTRAGAISAEGVAAPVVAAPVAVQMGATPPPQPKG